MTTNRIFTLLGLGLALGGAACGGSSSGGNGGDGGTGGTSGSTNSTSTTGSGSTGDCASLVQSEDTTPVTIRFVNKTAADIYVKHEATPNCIPVPALTIKDPDGQELAFNYDSSGSCSSTCQHYTSPVACTITCGGASVVRVTPQAAITVTWNGAILEDRMVPIACLGINANADWSQVTSCQRELAPKAFPLSLVASAGTSATCGGGDCTCTPDASGTCTIEPSGQVGGTMMQATASYSAGATSVDVVFQ